MNLNSSPTPKREIKSVLLVEDSVQDQLSILQEKFVEFIRIYDEMVEFEKKLSDFSRREYDRAKDEV